MEQYLEVIGGSLAALLLALIGWVLLLTKKLKDESGGRRAQDDDIVIHRLDRMETAVTKMSEQIADLTKLAAKMEGRLESIRINGSYGQRRVE